ncbi:sensor domain-containing diguanylate cyclase [Simiduia sp. 21SJ11W-1]|uniref:GGDEF domain-containing protein n=1 Tax=Simiduia sp. 21SJ11W-1 TaxID=2909669 RepID=UPI00209E788E|nr:DUF484 family protein [Simiduia sp. 21SJ11W-1]UTA46598.1 sensor domain-containing diguanylate cyclase [Simiduia sp. 21SJ11W-1]
MDLAAENQRLQGLIDRLVARIDDNQRIAQRFQAFEFQLLEAASLPELFDVLIDQAPRHFQLQAVSLVLFDKDYVLAQLFDALNLKRWLPKVQLRHREEFFEQLYGQRQQPVLGEVDTLSLGRLFPGAGPIGSCALLPLRTQGRLQGSLHLASEQPERFTPDKAADFLQHLGAILALCIEHCVAREQLRREGRQDPLTKVGNRAAFEQDLPLELARAERNHQPVSCFFVDLDHFKKINDNFGHSVGDVCLREVAAVLQKELRKTDVLARFGGEEFVVLLPVCDAEQAMETAQRVSEAIATMRVETSQGQPVPLTASIGVCSWEPRKHKIPVEALAEALLRQADAAMYLVKKAGRNGVRWQPLVVQ